MQIDQTFLRVHPATALWWQQREQCKSCRHMRLLEGGVLRCAAAHHPDAQVRLMLSARAGADVRPYCIDARGEKGDCGPDARLWEGKE